MCGCVVMFGVRVRVNRFEVNTSGGGKEVLNVIEPLVKSSATAWTSVRLHVLRMTASRTLSSATRPETAATLCASRAMRSRRSRGAVRWLTPTTRTDMPLRTYAVALIEPPPFTARLRRCSEASLFVVRDDLQLNGKVYSSNADAERHVNHHGCEVKNARDPLFTSRSAASWAAGAGVAITPIDTER